MAIQKLTPKINFDLNHNPARVQLSTVRQFEQWLEKEETAWNQSLQNLSESTRQYPGVRQACQHQSKHLKQSRQWVNQTKQNGASNVDSKPVKQFLEQYRIRRILHSESSIGKSILSKFQQVEQNRDLVVAGAFFTAALRQTIPNSNLVQNDADIAPILEGYGLYAAFTHESVSPHQELHDEANNILDQWHDRFETWNDTFETIEQNITDKHGELEALINTFKRDAKRVRHISIEQLKGAKSELSEFETYYREALRTEAPIRYWTKKARAHRIAGICYGVMFGLLTLVLAGAGFWLSSELLQFSSISSQADFGAQFLTRLSIIIVPAFFSVWFVRIVARLFLNNLRLYDDAQERTIMIQTYISLMEHEEKMNEADRILMLQALFRSSSASGDDDGAPPNWFDVLVQRVRSSK